MIMAYITLDKSYDYKRTSYRLRYDSESICRILQYSEKIN